MSHKDNSSDCNNSITGYDYEVYSNIELPQNLNFSLDEIRHQLNLLGYTQVPDDKLLTIKKDLDEIISRDDNLKDSVDTSKQQANNDWFVSGTGCELDNDDLSFATVTSLSPNSSRVKRKTVRKGNSNNTEDFTSEQSTPRACYSQQRDIDENYFRKVSFPQDPVNNIYNYTGVFCDTHDFNSSTNEPKRPSSKTSLIKTNIFKSNYGWQRHDPVSRYHSYKAAWNQIKAPGESPHKQLRWAVKAALMVREEPRPRINKVNSSRNKPNYLPPGENKRNDLRWQVRQEMANPDVYFD